MRPGLVTLVVVLLAARAHAEPGAEDLYAQGQAAYDAADYATAIARWTQSYELSHEPELLFNVAQARRLGGDCVGALATYKRFVAMDPSSAQRPLADDFVKELETRCGMPTERPRIRPGRSLKIAGLATGGGGLALLTTGLLFGRHASSLGDDVNRACATLCDWAAQRDKDARGRRYATVGYALDGLGVAAIAGGAILYVVGQRRSSITVAPQSSEGGAMVTWSGSW